MRGMVRLHYPGEDFLDARWLSKRVGLRGRLGGA